MTYSVIYYLFAVLIIASSFYLAFGKNLISSIFAMLLLLYSSFGLYVILNAELYALISFFILTALSSLLLILYPKARDISIYCDIALSKHQYIVLTISGIFTAVLASITGSTRWTLSSVNYDINNFTLVFNKYLPLILLIVTSISVVIFSFGMLQRKIGEKL